MQGFKSESFGVVGDHSQKVKALTASNDSGLKDCVNLPSSTAVSRFKVDILALHGFLGTPQDWSFLGSLDRHRIHSLNLFDPAQFNPMKGLWAAGRAINDYAASFLEKPVLMGYSLGGRLGLHALMERQDLWHGAVIVSAHPGLNTLREKEARYLSDLNWADRFESGSWEDLMEAWNAQPVFRGLGVPREECAFDRLCLAQAIRGWSLGRQDNLLQAISCLRKPILWITGEQDLQYNSLAAQIRFSHPKSRLCILRGAGHRVPWDNPSEFMREITHYLHTLEQKDLP